MNYLYQFVSIKNNRVLYISYRYDDIENCMKDAREHFGIRKNKKFINNAITTEDGLTIQIVMVHI